MEYKRSYAGEITGIIIVIVLVIMLIVTIQSPRSSGTSYNDSLEKLDTGIKDARLDESPMTIEKAKYFLDRILHLRMKHQKKSKKDCKLL